MRSSVIWKFFGAFTFLTFITAAILNFSISSKLRDEFERKITEKLRSNATLVSDILKSDPRLDRGQTGIQKKILALADKLNLRITVIDKQGKVLGDSEKDPSTMENHSNRPEVIEAVKNGFGQSTRFSDTLGYNMKYVAVRVDNNDGNLGVVRFALALSEVQLQTRVIYRTVLWGAIAAIIIAITMAYFISRGITSPIKQMQQTAERIAQGDFSRKITINSKDELGNLAKSLTRKDSFVAFVS